MMPRLTAVAYAAVAAVACLSTASAHVYNETLAPWNMNTNQQATTILEYTTTRSNTTYMASPQNWRSLPTYTLLLDKWFNGDPSNDDFFGLQFEAPPDQTQLRFGGDVAGISDDRALDYLQGLGIKAIYIAGTAWLNMPWQADAYSAIDFTLTDPHFGTVDEWHTFIDKLHARGMYIIMDMTVGTMGDVIGFKGHLNSSTPFSLDEYEAVWKLPPYAPWGLDTYPDWTFTNTYNSSCEFPVFWQEDGTIVQVDHVGCYASEFDQYGDVEAFGVFPDWQRQLAKFASVQDRLREWNDDVNEKLRHIACLTIQNMDVDGMRIDKATQMTVQAHAVWANGTRACARQFGKENFFIPGEITGGDTFGALYIGRGRTPQQLPAGFLNATTLTQDQNQYFLREEGMAGLDSAAFHYSIYRSLTRFLGMDGNLNVAYDVDINFVTAWNQMVVNDEFLNSQTNEFDPRHMYGSTNQDVFRWPSLTNGTHKNALANFVTTLLMPGIPLMYYGEEQGFYLYDNGASNYLYGRQAMTSTRAWQMHGCYQLGSSQYFNMPLDKAMTGCFDDWNSLDHFDASADGYRLNRHLNYLRQIYPSLQDGFNLVQLGNWTHFIELPGSNKTATELGLWTAQRSPLPQQIRSDIRFNQTHGDYVWLLYTNENQSVTYTYDCGGTDWISTPYTGGTQIRNLFYPYENYTLQDSKSSYNLDNAAPYRGCLGSIDMQPYEFKAFVPAASWVQPQPSLSRTVPSHDSRLPSASTVSVRLEFDTPMDCTSVTNALSLRFSGSGSPSIDKSSVQCQSMAQPAVQPSLAMVAPSQWYAEFNIINAGDGIYDIVVASANAQAQGQFSAATEHILLRVGAEDNVMVWDSAADYSSSILTKNSDGSYAINHAANGADKYRYSTNFGQKWSAWQNYEATTSVAANEFADNWWKGQHIQVQYWSAIAGSAASMVHGDVDFTGTRKFPQLLARGSFNEWGYDAGTNAHFSNTNGTWTLPMMGEWPTYIQINVFDFNDYFYGDTDGDGILDLLPPNSQSPNYLNLSSPPTPHMAWNVIIDENTLAWTTAPIGHYVVGVILFALLLAIPPITAFIAAAIFRYSFYSIKVNKWGIKPKAETSYFPLGGEKNGEKAVVAGGAINEKHGKKEAAPLKLIGWPEDPNKRRKVLIATLEYEIIDWKLKVKIGGLGVMSSLMGKAMNDVDLIWVVPKVKDLEYPQGDYAEPIEVVIFGEPYLIEVETHQVDNITYVILDSPVFRAQTKSDPYPQRMDDLSSAIFYSTWNQAIAETIKRYPIIDIYHINDYHGALAPLYLLPKILPVCLSLHNAEFQGLWPLRTKDEMKEVCAAFNIPKEVCSKYVQFGNTFNLLHAAASFISLHQKSIGVAGVSDKYGKRSWARYPALWTLRNIDSLPNPDPTDIAALDTQPVALDRITIDQEAEAQRPENKRQAQEWAGLKQDPDADLFVFVGRWSKQKGVDLIADVMPSILDKKPKVQLITVGPVIDLYGRFAAEKLARLMEMYPDRVFSKPEFTALPPYLFSGADFALIPSRDEPFGLVAVEFGRKGALGVGSRLGGLGLMPGWWFPVESSATVHMLSQLTKTIKLALKSSQEERAILRARSAVQRFPVVEWRQRLEDFHRRSITVSRSIAAEQAYYFDMDLPPAGMYQHQNMSDMSLVGGGVGGGGMDSPALSHTGSFDNGFPSPSPLASPSQEGAPMAAGSSYHRRFEGSQHLSAEDPSKRRSNRASAESFYEDDPDAAARRSSHVPPLYYDEDNQAAPPSKKFYMGGADPYDDDDSEHRTGSEMGDSTAGGSFPGRAGGPAQSYDNFLAAANRQIAKQSKGVRDPFMDSRQSMDLGPNRPFTTHSRTSSFDSISSIMDEKGASSPLNKAIVDFTDSDGEVAQSFVQKLQALTPDNSKTEMCIEKYLIKSEKAFFAENKKNRMSSMMSTKSSRDSFIQSRAPSMIDGYQPEFNNYGSDDHHGPYGGDHHNDTMAYSGGHHHDDAGSIHAEDKPMTRLQMFMSRTYAGWPLYTIIISIGQLLGATSFQLTLLTGNNSQNNTDLYIIGAIFLVASIGWYAIFRVRPSLWVLSLPWIFYAIAFFLIGLPSLHGPFTGPQKIITSVATWFYAVASAAGFLFFGCNFGEEAGAATEVWILRACIVQGLQQVWVSVLWYWGSTLSGKDPKDYISPTYVLYAVWPLAVMSIIFAYLMFWGLPEYYRQIPPYVPNFFKTLFRRKLVWWFLISEILRDYWLSGPYGRNWSYLWNKTNMPQWAVVILIVIFFIGIWGLVLGVLIKYSKVHSWLLPVFAVGLGAPRWCQIWWGTSGVGYYLPWAGAAGPYVGTGLWLWLGVLDAIQGVGLGMILLQTLSRLHVCATLAMAQVLGSVVVMIARATAPDKTGPGIVFPDPAIWDIGGSGANNPLASWAFWLCLACQIVIVIGYFIFFRKEQLVSHKCDIGGSWTTLILGRLSSRRANHKRNQARLYSLSTKTSAHLSCLFRRLFSSKLRFLM